MTFPMTEKLRNYDVFPLVFPAQKQVTVHIRPLGGRQVFVPGREYTAEISGIRGGYYKYHPASADFTKNSVFCKNDGAFEIVHTYASEQEYFIRIYDEKVGETFSVYTPLSSPQTMAVTTVDMGIILRRI